jgi:hypothetical protein
MSHRAYAEHAHRPADLDALKVAAIFAGRVAA